MFRVFNCLATEHDWRLVALAVIVCLLASLTSVNLLRRAKLPSGHIRALWLLTAGFATGCGIWATHFIAILAYTPGLPITYGIGLTAASLVAAVVVTTIGLAALLYLPTSWNAALGGIIVASGVTIMHYLGMMAVQLPGRVTWDFELVIVSVLLGTVFTVAALAVAVRHRHNEATFISALLLTAAITSLHFTGMGAVEIIPDPTRTIGHYSLSPTSLALALANAALALLALSLVSAFADRRLRERDRRLATAVNNMTQGLVMFDPSERMVVCNDRYIEMYGLSRDVVKPGCTLTDIIRHRISTGSLTRDAEEYRSQLLDAMARKETISWVVEADNGRAISVVNRPIAGGDWVGVHEDISERRRSERELESTRSFLDKVIENVPVTISVKSLPDFRYTLINRVAQRHYGVAREQMIGKTSTDVFPPAWRH